MAGVSFIFFDLGNAISGSLFVNLGEGLKTIFELATDSSGAGAIISVFLGGFMGLFAVLTFPIHWLLYYRPNQISMAIAMLIPWILAISISAAIFARSSRQGLFIGVYLAIGCIIFGVGVYILITAFFGAVSGTNIGTGVINGIFQGLTGLHPILAVFLAVLEGCLIGAAFGAFIGALKYNAEKEGYKPKKRKKKGKRDKDFKMDDSDSDDDTLTEFPYEVGEY